MLKIDFSVLTWCQKPIKVNVFVIFFMMGCFLVFFFEIIFVVVFLEMFFVNFINAVVFMTVEKLLFCFYFYFYFFRFCLVFILQ